MYHMNYRLARVFHELLNATLFTFDVSIYYTCIAYFKIYSRYYSVGFNAGVWNVAIT